MHLPTDRIAHTIAFITPVVEHWLECEIAQMDPKTHHTMSEHIAMEILIKHGVPHSWCDGSSDRSFMVDPLSYFSFQPVLNDWCNKGCYIYVILSVG